jgi:hypothetical protein
MASGFGIRISQCTLAGYRFLGRLPRAREAAA